ncbi:hypothetical protein I302_102640 [Kwoniella bestiolae CBS 10118]|uniref:Uncharacterized protein n=1 Tax=Kwoniella bestiolae CBS 10118 TaxID=1296100 RepID=A0A1B9GFJ1_9TREE|nr:hypothetical protein I302_01330 [Kwoniella bestiolae CBS 10118]OCF29817.1 hypothetical protein I302_01330 [Kwoniella bestiolae CBS 10118]
MNIRTHEVYHDTSVTSINDDSVNSGLGKLGYSILPACGRESYNHGENFILTRKEEKFKRLFNTAKELGMLQMLRHKDTFTGSQGITNLEQELNKQYRQCAHRAESLVNEAGDWSRIFKPFRQRVCLDENNAKCPERHTDPGNRTALKGDDTMGPFNSA